MEHKQLVPVDKDTEKVQEDMIQNIEKVKMDLQIEIAEYEKNEVEMQQLKSLEQLKEVQDKLWQEKKNLYLLNQAKKRELDNLKNAYNSELHQTQTEIEAYNNMKQAQN